MINDAKYNNPPFSILVEWLSSMGCDEVINSEGRRFYGIRTSFEKKLEVKTKESNIPAKNDFLLDDCKSLNDLKIIIKNKLFGDKVSNTKNFIFNEGNATSDLMVIGGTPETLDINNLISFQGEIGFLLMAMLKAINFDEKNTYFTSLCFSTNIKGKEPTLSDVEDNVSLVKKQIEFVKPKVIILFGSIATQSLTGKKEGIFATRGKWYNISVENPDKTFPAISMYHPGFLITRPDKKKETWADLIEVKKRIDTKR